MTTVYDEQTSHGRLIVAYDRYGITIREWNENDLEDADTAFLLTEGWFSWENFWKRERTYSGDNGGGTMKRRLVTGAISLLGNYGGETKPVDTLEAR